ncbi:MAG: 50S ribosomal protein L3 [Patescibacteria group bacterium]|nr:50S ribosomal protein L3 [Patescibacteria group bacterium]
MKFILGRKLGMSQIFGKNDKVIPVTLVEVLPCQITQIKTGEKDGYQAVQVGFGEVKEKKLKKPQKGHIKKAGLKRNFGGFMEFRGIDLKVGDEINIAVFKEGDEVKVAGVSKGKGFQGVVKRHGFSGMPASHGTKHCLRAPGSIGSAFPQRVFKGRKMAGRMGFERVTVRGLQIARVDEENNLLAIKGAVPGTKGTLLEIVGPGEIKLVEKDKE